MVSASPSPQSQPYRLGGGLLGSFSRRFLGTPDDARGAAAPSELLHVALLGQSNAVGQGDTSKADIGLNLTTAYPAVTVNEHVGNANTDPIVYQDLATGSLQPYHAGGAAGFGYELTMGRHIDRTKGASQLKISKIAVNGQDIETMLAGAGIPTSPEEMWLQIIGYLDARVTEYGRAIDYVVWSQWEADATSDAKANAYSGHLDTFFGALRARYGNFKIIMLKASSTATGAGVLATSRDIIRATQISWCGISGNNAVLVDTDGLPLTGNIHYNEESLAYLGVVIGEIIASDHKPGRNSNVGAGPAPWIQGNLMPAKSSTAAAAITPYLDPHQAGDILVVVMMTSTANVAPTLTIANGFTLLGMASGNNGAAFTLTSVYTKVAATSNESPPTITPGAGVAQAVCLSFTVRGSSGVDGAFTTSGGIANPTSWTAPATTAANDLVVFIAGGHSGSQTQSLNSFADANLTTPTLERNTRLIVNANGELIGLCWGTRAAAGASGPGVGTYATAPIWSCLAVAFQP